MSSSFALWRRRAFSSHSPLPEAILSLFMSTWPTLAHSFQAMSSHPWKARICIPNLSQAFGSSFGEDLCRNFLLHYIPGTTDLGGCDSSPISGLAVSSNEHSCILTKVFLWIFLHSCINCKHKGKSNHQGSQCLSRPAAYRKCLCCCILSQLFMKNFPPHLLWWSCGEFVDHISEWQSAYNRFSKSELFEEEKGDDLFSAVFRYWKEEFRKPLLLQ